MVRYLALLLVVTSCSDDPAVGPVPPVTGIEPDTGAETAPEPLSAAARVWLEQVLPMLEKSCIGCHGAIDPTFLRGATPWEIRDTLLGSGLVEVAAPETSSLLTKGAHSGPALTIKEAETILEWLRLEQ